MISDNKKTIKESLLLFIHPRIITMFFFGFSAGLPLYLIFSSLSLWLREAGIERSAVTFFSWAALAYSFKFLWSPIVDGIPIYFLTKKLGRRRAWLLFSQAAVFISMILMGLTDPSANENAVVFMAFATILLGFSSATQDIVIDAYRIESAGEELQAMMASSYIAGYRIGMITAGAGALFLADYLGSGMGHYNYNAWKITYFVMAGLMSGGMITTLVIDEPEHENREKNDYSVKTYLSFFIYFIICVLSFILFMNFSTDVFDSIGAFLASILGNGSLPGFISEFLKLGCAFIAAITMGYFLGLTKLVHKKMVMGIYVEPVKDFFERYGLRISILLLALIGLYRISDIVLGIISNLFYQDLGFTKTEIAGVVKTFGLLMTIAGGFLGGVLSPRFGVMKLLFAGAVLSSATNLLFMFMSSAGNNIHYLYFVISADNLASGLAGAAFVAFLSSLTNIKFTAVQYAVFSSIMTLIPKLIGGYSGTMVDSLGYETFFFITFLMGIPVLVLIFAASSLLKEKDSNPRVS